MQSMKNFTKLPQTKDSAGKAIYSSAQSFKKQGPATKFKRFFSGLLLTIAGLLFANELKAQTINCAGKIIGPTTICVGSTAALTESVGGGTWSSSATTRASVSSTGVVTGVAAGTAIISYALASASCGAIATFVVTINTLPVAPTFIGTEKYCAGSAVTYTASVTGGNWSSSAASVVTVNATGVATGVAQGTAKITYTVANTCGNAYATKGVTINPLPAAGAISGTAALCVGTTANLSDAAGSGVWSSSSTTTAAISSLGVVTGFAAGTATISYSVTNSCGTANATKTVTVNSMPNAGTINGTASLCTGATVTLSDATSGGAWSSSSAVASLGLSGGAITGSAAGTATISYTVTNSCGSASATKVVTVNPLPNAGAINGTSVVCAGATVTLSDAASSGTWNSSSAATASISESGIVTGSAAGTATISYTVINGCGIANATTVVTINPLPNAGTITGIANACAGSITTLVDGTIGGVWSSDATAIATVDATGVVTGVAQGTANISYTVTNSCGVASATAVVTIKPLPNAGTITGIASVCAGSVTTLADAANGGAWSSNASATATVNAAGIVTGSAHGTANISYTVTNSCGVANATTIVTINPLPNAGTITGIASVCAGSVTTLTAGASGGVWSSDASAIATIDASGAVTGVAQGTSNISYTVTNGCGVASATAVVTINPLPNAGAMPGAATVCVGSVITLTAGATGGVWSGDATTIASVDATGVVTGIAAGTANISYTVTNGCGVANATTVVTINPLPNAGAMPGAATVCAGSVITLTAGATGGVWSSDATAIATVNASGVVTGIAQGMANILYTVTNGCGVANASTVVTVNPLPYAGAVPGVASVCAGSVTMLTAGASGGVWSSGATDIATVDATGVVTGIAPGSANISYTVTNSCGVANATRVVVVNPLPSAGAIPGIATVCVGSATTLAAGVSGGVWSSDATGVATVDAAGVLTGIAAGSANIAYTVTNSCGVANATRAIIVNPLPVAGAITGIANACVGAVTALSNVAAGGVWTSGSTGIATVNASGTVTGIAAGTATISYAVTNSCGVANAVKVVTMNALPNAGTINGAVAICAGTSRSLSDVIAGGAWSSATPAIATVSASGMVTAVAAGVATISYTVTNSSCAASAVTSVPVNPIPSVSPIIGSAHVRYAADTTLIDSVAGGTWTASNTHASVTGGLVHGLYPGTVTISYTYTNSCGTSAATKLMTVDSSRTYVSSITGSSNFACVGGTAAYWSATSGGVFTIGPADTAVATTTTGGRVTGVSAGTATLSYTYMGSTVTSVLTVYPVPAVIAGPGTVCMGAQITLSDATPGGVWTSGIPSTATIGASAGVVTATNAGVVPMYYTIVAPAGCRAQINITVNPNPAGITSAASVCMGSVIALHDATPGGTWSGTNTHASIDTAGNVTGLSVGGVDFTYTLGTGCYSTHIIAINGNPTQINGNTTICTGVISVLSDANTTVLPWTSSTPAVATVSAAGVVTGIAAGTTTITFKLTTGCYTTTIVSVNPTPSVSAIVGPSSVSHTGGPVTLSDITTGGVWTSDHTAIITVGSSTGIVTAVSSSGSANIQYTVTNGFGCRAYVTKVVTASAAPQGRVIAPADTASGDAAMDAHVSAQHNQWTSSTDSIAVIDRSGNVTALPEGNVTITQEITDSEGQVSTEVTEEVISQLPIEASVVPNPNKGSFVVKGTVGTTYDATVSYQITSMTGQIVYRSTGFATNGVIEQSFALDGKFASGMYVLIVRCGDQHKNFNFVVEK